MKLLFLFLGAVLAGSAQIPVWVDTDPAVARGGHEEDDGFALLQAFHSPELAVRGVSIVFGNAPLVEAYPIGRRLVQDFGPSGTPVYPGAASSRDLGNETDASRALAQALQKEKLTVIALGPATNIATVLKNHPELARRIVRVVAVAGRRRNQHFTARPGGPAFRDFNFELDPAAFQTIIDSRVSLVLTPWEISSQVWLRAPDLARIRTAQPNAGWMLDAAVDWLAFWKQKFGVDGFNPFDTLAVGYVASSAGFGCKSFPVELENAPDDTGSGKTFNKPYLIVDSSLSTKHSALYCSRPPEHFADQLVNVLCSAPTWNALLRTYVNTGARVDYQSLKQQAVGILDRYVSQLAQPWPKDMRENETKALLINAYNALTVRWMTRNYPVESIWRTQHPFTESRHIVNGKNVSLDQIETRLRDMGDPRIHGALVCASLSCPPLRREAYTADQLDRQLDDNVHAWLANPQLNQFDVERRQAKVSMIFKWYAADFVRAYGSVEKFLVKYGPTEKTAFFLQPNCKLDYLPYRWGINDTSSLGENYSAIQLYWDGLKNKYF